MRTLIFFFLLLASAAVAQSKESKPPVAEESVKLNDFHIQQLKAFDQQQKDIQTAAAVLENDRKLFINTLLGREVNHAVDSVLYDQASSSIKVYKRKVPLQPNNR